MTKQRYCIVHGMGRDAVGLVGKITAPIAQAKGNIIDLRQDVLHGLFTIYLVVDLKDSSLDLEAFRSTIASIVADTGLQLTVDPYAPVPRPADKKNLLMILIGKDKPGIIAASSEMLGKYNANIEFAQTIGREGIFLMELLTDISQVAIPVDNLKRTLSKNMEALSLKTVFQDEHVFNKKKRVILFNITLSFLDAATRREIMEQTGLTDTELKEMSSRDSLLPSAQNALARLDGLPLDVADAVLESITPSSGSLEMVQTLKTMGYKIVLVSSGLAYFTNHLKQLLDLDYAYGIPHPIDDDTRALVGEAVSDEPGSHDIDSVLSRVAASEKIDREDITIITDEGCDETPGIRLQFNLEMLLAHFNQRILSKDNLLGLLGGFGIPDLN